MRENKFGHKIMQIRTLGEDEDWIYFNLQNPQTGIDYVKKINCRNIFFGWKDASTKPPKMDFEILNNFHNLNAIIWQSELAVNANPEPLYKHKALKFLDIRIPKLKLDLSNLLGLEYLSITDSKLIEGYASLSKLRELKITSLIADLKFLRYNEKLENLEVRHSKICSLEGVESIPHLNELRLLCIKNFTDASHISKCMELRYFNAESVSPISDYSFLSKVKNLSSIWLMAKNIESCKFLNDIKSIEFFSCNAIIKDDDISPTINSASLKEVWLSPNRKTYFPKKSVNEINEHLASKHNITYTPQMTTAELKKLLAQ